MQPLCALSPSLPIQHRQAPSPPQLELRPGCATSEQAVELRIVFGQSAERARNSDIISQLRGLAKFFMLAQVSDCACHSVSYHPHRSTQNLAENGTPFSRDRQGARDSAYKYTRPRPAISRFSEASTSSVHLIIIFDIQARSTSNCCTSFTPRFDGRRPSIRKVNFVPVRPSTGPQSQA